MLYAADFRAKARRSLTGNWGKAVGVGFVASLLGAATTGVGGGGGNGSSSQESVGTTTGETAGSVNLSGIDSVFDLDGIIPKEYQVAVLMIISIITFLGIAFMILHFVIGGAVTLGYVKFNLSLVDAKPASFAQLFSEFHRLGAGIVMQLLRTIYIVLWTLLLIIPGIYAAYGYTMTPYILMENPEMTANQAIGASKELMNGNRWRFFCLEISFIGWHFLCIFLTLGIGYLWLMPYMEASFAAFYREISAEKYGREQQKETTYEGTYNGRIV